MSAKCTTQLKFKPFFKNSVPVLQVLYPVIQEIPEEELPGEGNISAAPYCAGYHAVFVSLNRYKHAYIPHPNN